MNLLLLEDGDFVSEDRVELRGRRAAHAHAVLAAQAGDSLRVGRLGGQVGVAEVVSAAPDRLVLRVRLTRDPPARPGLDVLLAIPRPKALKKVLPALASLGVGRLVLVNAQRVEKSYFQSHVLTQDLDEHLRAGLEQAQDTKAPEVLVRERFRPFVEDELADVFGDAQRLLAHPTAARPLSEVAARASPRAVVAIGPEGGWIPFELALLEEHGFLPFSLGPRTLRVEVVVPFVLGQLAALRSPTPGG